MIISCSSHRAVRKLLALYPAAEPYYYEPKLFQRHSFKAYYLIRDEVKALPKGTAKARDQNLENYGHCW